jgi:hypothetical protein
LRRAHALGAPPSSMSTEDTRAFLSPAECRDEETLRRFVEEHISVNAWPIHAHSLRRLIREQGIDLGAARAFSMSLEQMEAMMNRLYARSRRVERMLGIDNAFHTTLHNVEVLLRMLVLEWPPKAPMPEHVRLAPNRVYRSFERIREVVLDIISALVDLGVPGFVIARDALAALGHDFGHSGGTDRVDRRGAPAPLTHEEMSEKHVAKLGVEHGYPAALILESMAGIRATTFFSRPGRARILPANEFERRLTLADVMGCVLPPDQWLTHVGVPVLKEKIPVWKRRMTEIAGELEALTLLHRRLPEGHPDLAKVEAERAALALEDARIIRDIEEWFRSERGFFVFLENHKLEPVAGARALWGDIIKEKIALMDGVLQKKHLLEPLVARGFAFLEEYAQELANVESLSEWLRRDDIDPRLREILAPFVPSEERAAR